MKKRVYILAGVLLGVIASVFTACGQLKVVEDKGLTEDNTVIGEEALTKEDLNTIEDLEYKVELSAKDELFELKLYLDKDTYTKDESIHCYATLEYIGEENSIIAYSADPLVGFSLKDDKYFDGLIMYHTILMPTTLNKSEVIQYDYVKSGGWAEDEPNAEFYREFYAAKELKLPAGTYDVTVAINCFFDREDELNSKYNSKVTANITVTE